MPLVEKIDFADIPGLSRIFLHYSGLAADALAFYQDPPTVEALRRKADEIASYGFPRRDISAVLERQNRSFRCGGRTLDMIEDLRSPDCVAVVTGQQVGFFTGPLYTIYKALTAVRLAEELRARGTRAVPVFWMDTEDHDLSEVTEVGVLDAAGDLRALDSLALLFPDRATNARPVGPVALPDGLDRCIDEYASSWADGPCSAGFREQLTGAYAAGGSISSAFGLAMMRLFEDRGLVLFDPLDAEAKQAARPVFDRAFKQADLLRSELHANGRRLKKLGFHSQAAIPEDSTLLFLHHNGERRALVKHGAEFALKNSRVRWSTSELSLLVQDEPEKLSPNVLLRPLVQDHLFPTAAYVAGPGEVAYYAQIRALYDRFVRPMPVIWPRAGFTLLDRNTVDRMERFHLAFRDCLSGRGNLADLLRRTHGSSDTVRAIEDFKSRLGAELAGLRPQLQAIDGNLGPALDKASRKMMRNVDRLTRRCARLETDQDQALETEAARIVNVCYPEESLQERVVGVYPMLALHGPGLLDCLYSRIELEQFAHLVVRFL
jgi:bacillithiol biosynthesis cysteine-adding enzyme BshC